MKISTFFWIRLSAIVLILLILAIHPLLPPKRELIYPNPKSVATLYSDDAWGGLTRATWQDNEQHHWRCQLTESQVFPVCGLAISFPYSTNETKNFAAYEALNITLKYTGDAKKLRFYLRNHNAKYSNARDVDSLKFNAVSLQPLEFNKGMVSIHLSEFAVADWWLEERNIPREWSRPEFDQVTAFGIDFPAPLRFGQHDIEIEKIELTGHLIKAETLYFYMIWVGILALLADPKLYFRFRSKHNPKAVQPK